MNTSLRRALVAGAILSAVSLAPRAHAQVVISQVYGGGGNAGSTFTNDFIELYNNGATAIDLTGFTIQYASATGAFTTTPPTGSQTPQFTTLSGTIASGGFFLVQEGPGAGGTTALPTPDAAGTIAISGTNGKVALVGSNTVATGPTGSGVLDFVGFGSANQFEGTAAVPVLSNTTAAYRKTLGTGGVQDTNQNSTDFTIYAINGTNPPGPRNSASPSVGIVGVAAAPEPSGMVALALGVGILGLMVARRRTSGSAQAA